MDNETEVGLLVSLCLAVRIGNIHKAVPRLAAQAKHPRVKAVLKSLADMPMGKRAVAAAVALPDLEHELLG